MTDSAKNFVWRATWLPFGGLHTISGSVANDYRFPGQWFQLEAGLHYNWHRHYGPTTGRYLQPDPLGMPDGPNRWVYALNSPLVYVDPAGQQVRLLGPNRRGGRVCGIICYGYGCRLDYHGYRGSPPILHFHAGKLRPSGK